MGISAAAAATEHQLHAAVVFLPEDEDRQHTTTWSAAEKQRTRRLWHLRLCRRHSDFNTSYHYRRHHGPYMVATYLSLHRSRHPQSVNVRIWRLQHIAALD